MKTTLKSLRTVVGRVWRDIDRKLDHQDEGQAAKAASILARSKRLLDQKPKDKNKLYRLHTHEVECISKGKVRQPYEFGVKVTLATTHKEGLVVGMRRQTTPTHHQAAQGRLLPVKEEKVPQSSA